MAPSPTQTALGVCLLAILLPILTLQIRIQLPIAFGERPLLVLFMLPITACALLGGLLPGLLCTLVSGLLTTYFLLAPLHELRIGTGQDLVQWGILIANGVLISLLSAAVHRSRAGKPSAGRSSAVSSPACNKARPASRLPSSRLRSASPWSPPDGKWLRVNRRLCDMLGYQADELMGMTFQQITHPDDLFIDQTYVAQMLADERQHYTLEKRYLRKGGEVLWITLTVALVKRISRKTGLLHLGHRGSPATQGDRRGAAPQRGDPARIPAPGQDRQLALEHRRRQPLLVAGDLPHLWPRSPCLPPSTPR